MTLSSALKKCITVKIIDCKTIAAINMILNSKNKFARNTVNTGLFG